MSLVEGGRVPPGRALDLGCGTGTNVIYLKQHGFDAVGVDWSARAIDRARKKAQAAKLIVPLYVADLTDTLMPEDQAQEAVYELLFAALRLLDEGRDPRLVTHVFALEEYRDAVIANVERGRTRSVKTLFRLKGSPA